MPITQQRMQDLIRVARAYFEQAREIEEFVNEMLFQGSEDAVKIFHYIKSTSPPPEFFGVLVGEERHFKMNAKSNERNRRRMQELRAESKGMPVSLQTQLRQRRKGQDEVIRRKQNYGQGLEWVEMHNLEPAAMEKVVARNEFEEGPSEAPDFSPAPSPTHSLTPGTTLDAQSLAARIEKESREAAALRQASASGDIFG